jgi:hypothetical protein
MPAVGFVVLGVVFHAHRRARWVSLFFIRRGLCARDGLACSSEWGALPGCGWVIRGFL